MSFSRTLKDRASKIWEEGYNHPFVQEIGQGILDKAKFQFYLFQDYQYLLQYAKVFALAAVKADSEAMMARFTKIQHNILAEEMNLHRQYMAEFGVNLEGTPTMKPSLFNQTYTANMLAIGQTGDLAEILAAVFPCAWTYSDYAVRLKRQYADLLEDNFYKSWVEKYASHDFAESFEWFYETLDELVAHKSEAQRERVAQIFEDSVAFEYLFWDMAYKREMSFRI